MSSAAAVRSVGRIANQSDRVFYNSLACAMAVTVFVGFVSTYYGKLLTDAPLVTLNGAPFTFLIHVHGVLFTMWVILFLVQTSLVASRRTALHRKMGIAGGVLALGMVMAGTAVAIQTATRAAAAGAPVAGEDPLSFLLIPLSDMLLFTMFVTAALWMRSNKETHKRLMVLAYTAIITAALARVPGVLSLGPPGFFGLSLLFPAAGVVYDAVTRRRVHPVYIWGGTLLVLSVPVRLFISETAAWHSVAELLTR